MVFGQVENCIFMYMQLIIPPWLIVHAIKSNCYATERQRIDMYICCGSILSLGQILFYFVYEYCK